MTTLGDLSKMKIINEQSNREFLILKGKDDSVSDVSFVASSFVEYEFGSDGSVGKFIDTSFSLFDGSNMSRIYLEHGPDGKGKFNTLAVLEKIRDHLNSLIEQVNK